MPISIRGALVLLCGLTLTAGCNESSPPVANRPASNPATDAPETPAEDPSASEVPVADAPGDATPPAIQDKPPATVTVELTPEAADQLVADAIEDWQADQSRPAKLKLEKVLAAFPEHRMALAVHGKVLHMEGRDQLQDEQAVVGLATLLEAEKLLSKLADTYDDLTGPEQTIVSTSAYDLACALALAGKKEEAIARLQYAVEHGWDSADFIEQDSDLDSLRELPAYQQLITDLKQLALDQVVEEMAEFKSFPFTFDLTDLDDKPLKLADLKGKVVIVDIWGTWCPPCRKEIPYFVRLQENYREQGLEIVGLTYERSDDKAEATAGVKEFAAEYKINYHLALGEEKLLTQLPSMEGYPTTLFIDREGKVRMLMVGLHSYESLEMVVKILLGPAAAADAKAPPKEQANVEPTTPVEAK